MPYYSHTLNSTHSHIIGRTDPITGDSVKENDSVVFCSNCQSCFLEDSWKYMNEIHCEQNQTLETVPTLPFKLIAKKRKEEVIAELKDKRINSAVYAVAVCSFVVSLIGSSISNNFSGITFMISAFIAVISGFLSSVIISTNKVKEFIGEKQNSVRLFNDRIEIGKDSFSWNDIEQIKYQREMHMSEDHRVTQNFSHTPFLLIYFKSGSVLKRDLATKNHNKTDSFLMGLEKISHFKNVFFYSENPQELRLMHNIRRNSKGKIEVGHPKKLLNY